MPITHMVWGEAGFFSTMGVFDFAGGIVMHITAGTAGLAAITPASGWVGPMGAMAIGFVASVVAYWAATWLKQAIGYDDALDVGAQFGTQAFAAATAIYPRSSPLSCLKSSTSS